MSNNTQSLTPEQLHEQALLLMAKFAASKNSSFLTKLIDCFSKTTRIFSCPTMSRQESNSLSHRVDDLVGGIPFTSSSYPWPLTSSNDLPMQPIVQLNLGSAGKILGAEIGSELLQVWGPVATDYRDLSFDSSAFLLRLIPQSALAEIPLDPPSYWTADSYDQPPLVYHMNFDESEEVLTKPRLQWCQPRPMFGSAQHFLELAWNEFWDESESFGSDELIDVADEFLVALSFSPLSNSANGIYIGGFGGQRGGEYDPSYIPTSSVHSLLVRVTDYNGATFAVQWENHKRRGLSFEVAFRYYG